MKLVDRRNKWKWKSNFAGTKKDKICNKNDYHKRFQKPKKMLTIWLPKFIPQKYEIWTNLETMWASRSTTFSEVTWIKHASNTFSTFDLITKHLRLIEHQGRGTWKFVLLVKDSIQGFVYLVSLLLLYFAHFINRYFVSEIDVERRNFLSKNACREIIFDT